MNRSLKSGLVASLFFSLATILTTDESRSQLFHILQAKTTLQERIIDKKADFDPPVKISLVKTKKGVIDTGRPFQADEDWLKGLSVQVTNTSAKTVTYVDIEILFRRPEGQAQEAPAGWDLEYGDNPFHYRADREMPPIHVQAVLPDESVEIKLSDSDLDQLMIFLDAAKYPPSIKKIELRVIIIGFSDGTAWSGRMLRRDLNDPGTGSC